MTTIHDFDWDDNYRKGTLQDGDLRAVILLDEYPDAPYFDGGDPIFDERGEQVYGARGPLVDRVGEAYAKTLTSRYYGREWEQETFERYVRIFHDGSVSWVRSSTYQGGDDYAVVALPALRREMGCSDELVNREPEAGEWQAYLDGEVFGVCVERRVNVETVIRSVGGEVIREVVHEDWESVEDSGVWGHYGDEYAVESAMEMLAWVKGKEGAA